MVNTRIEEKRAFKVSGRKVFITGQHNEEFGDFWKISHENGLVEKLKRESFNPSVNVTNSRIFGVSKVEKDPSNRAFYFYIASECEDKEEESFTIKSGKWAIFSTEETLPLGLIKCEMEAFMNWLPNHPEYKHDLREELEVYPEKEGTTVEFWLPIMESK